MAPTFGFEAEWETGISGLLAGLYGRGLLPDAHLHEYHCRCEECVDNDGYLLKAQSDSSCDGELISKVLRGVTNNQPLYREVQEAAVEADAEPGGSAGFHVHVSSGHLLREDGTVGASARDALWAFMRWEAELLNFAAGRFVGNRQNNRLVRRDLMAVLVSCAAAHGAGSAVSDRVFNHETVTRDTDLFNRLDVYMRAEAGEAWRDIRLDLTRNMHEGYYDRHTSLNLYTAHGTWEFRLWNSTRAAWRMELWCGLSVALMDVAMHRQMLTGVIANDRLPAMLERAGYSRIAELAERQVNYLARGATTEPLTVAA